MSQCFVCVRGRVQYSKEVEVITHEKVKEDVEAKQFLRISDTELFPPYFKSHFQGAQVVNTIRFLCLFANISLDPISGRHPFTRYLRQPV